ncbi:uncharacterized protein LOC112199489 [Rosa chinensis]|uniref:uncharacterized protein LOC112199489 n=1 Tax=Rosa chinensis TaxID=74649 RepID=UPI001AD8CAA7|nr:uncharacterized protein LOC112199489 [Rosa chinensis]
MASYTAANPGRRIEAFSSTVGGRSLTAPGNRNIRFIRLTLATVIRPPASSTGIPSGRTHADSVSSPVASPPSAEPLAALLLANRSSRLFLAAAASLALELSGREARPITTSQEEFLYISTLDNLILIELLLLLSQLSLKDEAKKRLQSAGYEQILEREDWKLEAGKKYYFTRNYSTIVAFAIGKKFVAGNGFHIVGAHTDSPCLKLKPVSKVAKGGYLEVGVQTYGGGLWHTWFDRDLIIAGRVMVREEKDGVVSYSHRLVRIEKPIMRIPTLAIHLDRDVREAFKVNAQSHLLPVLATTVKTKFVFECLGSSTTMSLFFGLTILPCHYVLFFVRGEGYVDSANLRG